MIGQETVVPVRIVEAAIGSLMRKQPIIAGVDQFGRNAQAQSLSLVKSRRHRPRVVINFGTSASRVTTILSACTCGMHSSRKEPRQFWD